MALIDVEHSDEKGDLSAHVVGVERSARIVENSPYDPAGKAMRG